MHEARTLAHEAKDNQDEVKADDVEKIQKGERRNIIIEGQSRVEGELKQKVEAADKKMKDMAGLDL